MLYMYVYMLTARDVLLSTATVMIMSLIHSEYQPTTNQTEKKIQQVIMMCLLKDCI